jgi:hypothetical protein
LMLNILEKFIKENPVDMVDCILTTAIFYRANLKTEEEKVKVDGLKRMEAIMKVILEITLLMDMENTSILADISIKVNGKIIFQMVKVKHYIPMDQDIMVSF